MATPMDCFASMVEKIYGKASGQTIQTKILVDHDTQIVKFAADRMLGKLAKWLRIMGQDVIYGRHLTGYGLIRAARQEGRLILTRDRRLKQKQPPEYLFIASDNHREQLR